jgi:hypothetical protein
MSMSMKIIWCKISPDECSGSVTVWNGSATLNYRSWLPRKIMFSRLFLLLHRGYTNISLYSSYSESRICSVLIYGTTEDKFSDNDKMVGTWRKCQYLFKIQKKLTTHGNWIHRVLVPFSVSRQAVDNSMRRIERINCLQKILFLKKITFCIHILRISSER